MYYETSITDEGYVQDPRPSALVDQAAQYAQGTGHTPVFVFSQEVTADPMPVLKEMALRLFNKGLTEGTAIHSFSLLELLSSGKSHKEMLTRVLIASKKNDGIVFIGDAYRYEYAPNAAFALLDTLARIYQNQGGIGPLIMKAPPPSDHRLFKSCPSLSSGCFHLSAKPYTPKGFDAQRQRPAPPPPFQQDSQPRRQEGAPEASFDIPPVGARNRPSDTEDFWYRSDPHLLQREYEGLQRYLLNKRLSFSIMQPEILISSARLCQGVYLEFHGFGSCQLKVIYENRFRQDDPSGVSIAIISTRAKQIRKRLSKVPQRFDFEIRGHLFKPNYNPNVLSSYGAGAAFVDAVIRAMI